MSSRFGAASKSFLFHFFSENKKYLVLPVDHLARRSIKIAAKRDSWCELQIF